MNINWKIIGAVVGVVLVLGVLGFWFFSQSTPADTPTDLESPFGTGASQSVDVTPINTSTNGTQPLGNDTQTLQQKIFRVADGPIVGATVVQTSRPITTLARYVQQNNGHVFDLRVDSAGAVPKAISNTTIPGVARVLWTQQGGGVILQYLDDNTVKTVSLSFPPQSATTTLPVTIKFLPDGIRDIAVSPSGANVVYLLGTPTGVQGYLAAADGADSRELFSLPLHEILILWPSPTTLLAQTKSAPGAPGVAFSINVSSGAVVPLLYASGLTLTADPTYSYIVYQMSDASGPSTYARNTADGTDIGLSFNPYPEKCIWNSSATSTMYCAAPLAYTSVNYLDLWHAGTATEAEAFYSFGFPSGKGSIIAVPGGDEGGVESTVDGLSISPDESYLLFVRRGDRSLWGVRLQ